MTFQSPTPTITQLIPENAPFSPEQRAWLNGFFAGFVAPQPGDAQPISADDAGMGAEEEDDAPWHDPSMAMDERMKLAQGKPIQRRLMAAMAQQDCGQCGYDCHNYSKAIADGAEEKLNLCVPGGKETARKVKELAAELGDSPAAETKDAKAEAKPAAPKEDAKLGYARGAPVDVTFLDRRRLNKSDSEKSTFHVDIDLSEAGIGYTVGDAFGLFPENDPDLVGAVIAAIGAPRDFPIGDLPLVDYLRTQASLGTAPDALFELVSYITGGERRAKAKLLAKGDDPDGDVHTLDVLAVLEKFPNLRPDPEAFVEALDPLQPRLYSISSSHNATPGRVSLTVDHVRYIVGARTRRGVASSWLAERLPPGSKIKAYVQKAHNFGLPQSTDTPIIMVGPGTGVAPFRAFLHDRKKADAKGGAWLFFGHQRRAADYFYEDEMEGFLGDGTLSKLSLAWSRDGEKKTYVQDKMREDGKEVWSWLERGAHFYICGDAKRMASDVEKALTEIVAKESGQDEGAAKSFITNLKKNGRYQADVY